MFIEVVSGVKYPKITTVGFVLKRPFVDVSSLCRSSFWDFFLFFFWDFFNIFCVWNFFCFHFERTFFQLFFPATCELVSRVELQSSLSRVFDCPLNWVFNPAQPHMMHELVLGTRALLFEKGNMAKHWDDVGDPSSGGSEKKITLRVTTHHLLELSTTLLSCCLASAFVF